MKGRGVGKRIPAHLRHRGMFAAKCDVCDVTYYDRQLRRMEDETILCTGPGTLNCAKGRVGVTLDRLNAGHAARQGTAPSETIVTGRWGDL